MELSPERPEPIYLKHAPEKIRYGSEPGAAIKQIMSGKNLLIDDQFSTGLNLLSALKKEVFKKSKHENESFVDYRDRRRRFHTLSNQILVLVKNGKIDLKKSPVIGWFKRLYSDHDEFYLTFPQIQGMNSSWQWYQNGIQYPVLDHKIYLFYGTYFPTRSDHLLLFEKYLKREKLQGKSVLDVGTGCGVLTFQMLKYDVSKILSSDINRNAVISVSENIEKMEIEPDKVEVRVSDLFENITESVDLIVFNPPWLPEKGVREGLDLAVYYPDDLFDRFFSGAYKRLNEGGKVVILFSNLAAVEGVAEEHPVISELALNRRFLKSKLIKHKADLKSKKTRRRDHRKKEYIELWELIPLEG